MAHPVNKRSHDQASQTGAGDEAPANGHHNTTVVILAENLDQTNDVLEVQVESSPTGTQSGPPEAWETMDTIDVTTSPEDPNTAGNFIVSFSYSGQYREYWRTRISSFTDAADGDLAVTSWVMSAGFPAKGGHGNPEHRKA